MFFFLTTATWKRDGTFRYGNLVDELADLEDTAIRNRDTDNEEEEEEEEEEGSGENPNPTKNAPRENALRENALVNDDLKKVRSYAWMDPRMTRMASAMI